MTSSNRSISALLALCAGNSPVIGEFPARRPVTRSFEVFSSNGWINYREVGDLRRHRAHYDVIVTPICGTNASLSFFKEPSAVKILSEIKYGKSTLHCSDVTISAMASQITNIWAVCSVVCPGAHQREYQSSASLTFVRGIHRRPVDYPHKRPVTWKMSPFDDVIMKS